MSAPVRIVVRSLGDLEQDLAWDDPEVVARLSPEKLAAFQTNPLRGGADDPAQLLALVDERVVGRVDLFRGEVSAFGEIAPILWGSNLHVPPAYRTTGAGAMLILRMSSLGTTVAGCGFSQVALPIYHGLRWTSFELPRWVLLQRSRAVLEKLLGRVPEPLRGAAAHGLALGADPLLAAGRAARGLGVRARPGLVARPADSLPQELDARLRADAPIFTHRSSRQLDWLVRSSFGDDPASRPPRRRLFLIHDDDAVVAYFLIKIRFHETASQQGFRDVLLGTLQDWFVIDSTRADVESIVLLAVRELLREGVDAVEIYETEPEIGEVVSRLGLRNVGATHFMFRAARGSRLALPEASARASWRITPAEGDYAFG